MSLYPLIHLLKNLSTRNRDPGDSLGRIALSSEEWQTLCAAVQHGRVHGLTKLDSGDRKRWGAAFLLVGARALRSVDTTPFTYEKIGQEAKIPALRRAPDAAEGNAIEAGADVWGIPLMRVTLRDGRRQRRFLGTMIRHSGAGWAILDRLAALVARQRRWDWVADTDIEALADWIDAHARRALGEQVQRNLDLETREALAARLQDLATVRALLGETTDPEAAIRSFGRDELILTLDAPDEDAARRMLVHFFPAPDDVTTAPRWKWHLDGEGYERVVIELPEKLRPPDDLPPEVNQIRLRLADDASPRGSLYVRDPRRGIFVHREGRHIRLPRTLQADLVAQFRDGQDTHEVIVAELNVPTAPLAVFNAEHGRLVTHPRAGMRVALVPAPGWRLAAPDGFIRGGQPPLEAWLGTMPGDLACDLSGPDGQSLPWTVSATPAPLQLTLTNAIAGLRLAHAPVVCGAPEFRSNIMHGRGTCTARGAQGLIDTLRMVIRGGRVKLASTSKPSTDWPIGVLSLDFALHGYTCTERIAVLPADTAVEAVSDRKGTSVTLRHREVRAKLHTRDSALPAEGGDGGLSLPPNVHGRVVIDYTLAHAGATWSGVWRIFAHPPAAEVVDANGTPRGDGGLSLLRSGGGLRIHGEPRSTVQLRIEDECWSMRLSPQGERVFRFIEIPSELLNREAAQKQVERLCVHIRWPNGDEPRWTFVIPENEKLLAKIIAGEAEAPPRVRAVWSRSAPAEVHLEAVRAWQPWAPSISLPARPANWPDWDGKAGYEAEFDLPAGSYQVALFSGEQRLSGVRLIFSPDGSLPSAPSHLSPLEAKLWDDPDIRELAPLVRRWSEEGDDETLLTELLRNVTRFGVKWFRIAEVLPEITGSWRLETLLREEPDEMDRLVGDYYEQVGLAWMFVRERDLARVAGRLYSLGHGAANTLLTRVAELDAGLLRAAARAWVALLSTHGPHQSSAIELQIRLNTYQPPQRISPEERDLLIQSDSEFDPTNAAPRLLGWRELQKHATALSTRLGDVNGLTNARSLPPPPTKSSWFDRLGRLEELELAVATWAWSVHRWRRGETLTFRTMRVLSRVEPLARKSFDYWLNVWDLLDPPKSGDNR